MAKIAPTVTSQRLSGSLLILLATLGFSSKAVLVKLAYDYSDQLDAITLMALRMLFSLPFFLIVAVWLHSKEAGPRLTARDGLLISGLGVLGFYLSGFLDFSGLSYIPASLERLILFLYPTLVVLFSALFYRRPVNNHERVALALSYLGIAVVFGVQIKTASPDLLLGSSLVFAAAVAFALYMMLSGEMVRRTGSIRFTALAMTAACVATGLHFGAIHELADLNHSMEIYALALLMALLSTVAPAFLMNAGIHRIGASSASIISSAGPVATLFLAYLFLDETLTPVQVAGTTLILAGVWLAGRKPNP